MSPAWIVHYLAAHWIEIAGLITTVLGIWLTTKRLLICWPITLVADFLYLAVFYQARLFSDALLQVFFVVFTLYGWWHWWRGVIEAGEVRVECGGRSRRTIAGRFDGTHRRGIATSRRGTHELQSGGELVGRA